MLTDSWDQGSKDPSFLPLNDFMAERPSKDFKGSSTSENEPYPFYVDSRRNSTCARFHVDSVLEANRFDRVQTEAKNVPWRHAGKVQAGSAEVRAVALDSIIVLSNG